MKDLYKNRQQIIQIIFAAFALLFILRLAQLQLFSDKYSKVAQSNAIKQVEIYPTRGLIYDRDSNLIVFNEAIYDLMVVPKLAKNVDSVKLCELLHLSLEQYTEMWRRLRLAAGFSPHKPSVFMKQMSMEDYSRLQEFLYAFPGFFGQVRTVRKYPNKCAALVLGDIGEVDEALVKKSEGYYKPGDYVGKGGIEKSYERQLGGTQGVKRIFVDALGREQGSYADGKFDTTAKAGSTIYSTIDIKLQEYGEELMKNKKGSIVAIDPKTGEILCLVSSPAYDPNLLCGAIRSENYRKLQSDSMKPLFNRATMATYPPGSTFKPIGGLLSLNEGVQGVEYTVPCNGVYYLGNLALHCAHRHPWAHNIQYAIAESCNPYFWQTFRNFIENKNYKSIQESYGKWNEYCHGFGLGARLNIDLPSEAKGNIPSVKYFNKMYGEKGWHSATIISLGIGQGELLFTPIQLCNVYATIANKGWFYTPHIVRHVLDVTTGKDIRPKLQKNYTKVSQEWFQPVIDGLYGVVQYGTASSGKIVGIPLCGKTGTVQNPHGDDHSLFAAFAPKEDPRIAIAVVVENAGFGSKFAVPIASLMIEKYLNDSIAPRRQIIEKRMMATNLIGKYTVYKAPKDTID